MTRTKTSPWETPPTWSPQELSAMRPPDNLRPSEWADRFRYLDPLVNAAGGRYSSEFTPYAREWMDSAAVGWVRQVTIVAGTQIGKTETVNNLIGYAIAQDPGPVMLVVPREKDIRTAQQRRIVPMIEATPALVAERTPHAHDETIGEILFRRSVLYVRPRRPGPPARRRDDQPPRFPRLSR